MPDEELTGAFEGSEEFAAEVDSAIDDLIAEKESDTPSQETGDGLVEAPGSSDADVVAEVDANDKAADDLKAADRVASERVANEEGDKIAEAAADAAKDAEDSFVKPTEDPPAVKKNFVSDATLARAVNVGIPVEDALYLKPGSLEKIITQRELAADDDGVKGDSGLQEQLEDAVNPFDDFPELDPEVHDPSVIAMFDKLKDITKGQYDTIQAFQAAQVEAKAAASVREEAALDASVRELEQFFDKQIEGLGSEFSESLGTGGYSSLDRGSSQFANREAIAGQMSVLISGYQAQGREPPSREEVFDMAARTVLRDTFHSLREKKLAGKLATQSGQHIQRAGSARAKATKTPDEDAASAVDEFLGTR